MLRWLAPLFAPWVWRMAWRDSRRTRGRLLLFVTSMTLGVAALVAISSFGDNLERAVAAQARDLLGADLRVRGPNGFTDATEELLAARLLGEAGGEESRQVSFTSMARIGADGAPRLVQVRALAGGYPFYGRFETTPAAAAAAFRRGAGALVDGALLAQFGAGAGDRIRVGRVDYEILGALARIPGESATQALFGPRVYLPMAGLDEELLARGSRVNLAITYRFPPGTDAERLREELRDHARDNRLRIDTVESTEERTDRSMENLYGFLNLVGFVALVLGALGVGSAIHVHVRRKIPTVATLRCLGARAQDTLMIYVASALVLGVLGAALGAGLGLVVQRLLPMVLADLLPVRVELAVSMTAVTQGAALGVLVALGFALLPLLPLRRVPPLLALRATVEPERPRRDPARLLLMAALVLLVFLFAWSQGGRAQVAFFYVAGMGLVFLSLALAARGLRALARRVLARRFPFEWRQGLANLYRPDNQTVLLMVSIGLGAFLVLTLYQTRLLLLDQLELAETGERPNAVLFDIQDDQVAAVRRLLEAEGHEVKEAVPIVNMQIAAVRGRRTAEIRADESSRISGWSLTREYRSTYRDRLGDSERLLAGEWPAPGLAGPPRVSLERRIAEELEVGVGDSITWDVQGVEIATLVGSVREVDWRRMQPNFFAVFPPGVLEDAPKFHVLVTRADGREAMGRLQRAVVESFPNISLIDVTLILEVADELLSRLSFVVRFMSMFSILTGLLVLVSSVLNSRFQRLEEGALLRTLGATRRRVTKIQSIEYLLLGMLATATGLLLSVGATWSLARFRFDLDFSLATLPLLVAFVAVTAFTLLLGRLLSRGLHDRPPLEVLRAEAS